eukprot:1004642_1
MPHRYLVDNIESVSNPGWSRPLFMVMVGVWWIGFSYVSLHHLPESTSDGHDAEHTRFSLRVTIAQLGKTLTDIREHPNAFKFLIALMFWYNGLTTILAVIGAYLYQVLEMRSSIGISMIVAQSFGSVGAWACYKLSCRFSIESTLTLLFSVWSILPIAAHVVLTGPSRWMFSFLISAVMGVCLGGNMALNRAFFAGMVPPGDEAKYMGLYTFFAKITAWTGPLIFAMMNEYTRSFQMSILTITPFFVISLFIMLHISGTQKQDEKERWVNLDKFTIVESVEVSEESEQPTVYTID